MFQKHNAAVLCFVLALCAMHAGAQPRIHTPNPVAYFGERLMSDFYEHDFIIENTGDDTLKIESVVRVCGCTAATPEKDTLQPGERTTIHAELRPMGDGRVSKNFYLITNDPENTRFALGFEGVFLPDILIDPKERHVGVLNGFSALEEPIYLRPGIEGGTFSLTGAPRSDAEWLHLNLEEIHPGTEYRITPKVADSPPSGTFTITITIPVDLGGITELHARITGYITPEYVVTPPILRYVVSDDATATRPLDVYVSEGRLGPFEIREAIPPAEGVKVEITSNETNTRHQLHLPDFPVGDSALSGKEIVLNTNLDTPVRIPIQSLQN